MSRRLLSSASLLVLAMVLLSCVDTRIDWTISVVPAGVTKLWVRGCWDGKIGDTMIDVTADRQPTLPLLVGGQGGTLRLRVWGLRAPDGLVTHEFSKDVELTDQLLRDITLGEVKSKEIPYSLLWGRNANDVWAVANQPGICHLQHWDGCAWEPYSVPGCSSDVKDLVGDDSGRVWLATKDQVWSAARASPSLKMAMRSDVRPPVNQSFDALGCCSENGNGLLGFASDGGSSATALRLDGPNSAEQSVRGLLLNKVRKVNGALLAVGRTSGPNPMPVVLARMSGVWDRDTEKEGTLTGSVFDVWESFYATAAGVSPRCEDPGQPRPLYSVWGRNPTDVWFGGADAVYRVMERSPCPGEVIIPDKTPDAKKVWAGGDEAFVAGGGLWHFVPGAFSP